MPIFQGYISYAPFPEGFEGDMDETFQQSGQLAIIYISGNFLTGLYYPVGTTPPPTLPTSDQGPIAANGQWYFWDPVTGQYLPQSASVKPARNYAKNATYQVQQLGSAFNSLPAGVNRTYDMVLSRVTQPNVLSVSPDVGPAASVDTDFIGNAIKYTVGTTLVPTLGATDLFVHEHLIEGSDIAGIQGEALSLSFSVWVNQPGNYSAYLTSTGRDASYVFPFSIATANTYARIKINNIPALPTGLGTWNFGEGQTGLYLGVVMGVGGQYQTTTPKQWVTGFFAGTSANSNMLTVTNNQIKLSAIKLESSPSATYFVANSFEADLHDAIRYYYTTYSYQSVTAGVSMTLYAYAANSVFGSSLFARRMCKVPTIVPYSPNTNTAGTVRDITTAADIALANLNGTAKGVQHQGTLTGAAVNNLLAAFITADARLA
jgi:hypothetical protein